MLVKITFGLKNVSWVFCVVETSDRSGGWGLGGCSFSARPVVRVERKKRNVTWIVEERVER